ncbi:D-alanyl-D-alanine carboxypeptidase family protein [Hydrogenophilus thiooxidans]|uniref:D-alanyl-D-alanine carboxypeptidase family protein n=1 Tax=Hydrogenophilus thiooxidans TaxID=2820326 RepID=UPI003D2B1D67
MAAAQAMAIDLPAKRWFLLDFTTGEVLAEQGADEAAEPASITKVMTAYLVFEALREGRLKWDQRVPVSEKAWKMGGSRMFVEPRQQPTVEALLRGLVVASGNDAAVALAEAVAGTEEAFVAMMNQTAQRLGMTNTHFADASGWPNPEHKTTARDLAILARALIRDFPKEYALFKEKEFTYNGIRQPNRNRLLWLDPTVDGLKTGHTQSAGYCLLSSAERDGRRLIAVTLGSGSDAQRTEASLKLLQYGFQNFAHFRVAKGKEAVAKLRVWQGVQPEVAVGAPEDLVVTLPRDAVAKATAHFVGQQPLIAPVEVGQQVGRIDIVVEGEVRRSVPVVALEAVPQAGWWGRTVDALTLWWQNLWQR